MLCAQMKMAVQYLAKNLRLCEETKTINCKTLVQNDKTKVTSKTASNELKTTNGSPGFSPADGKL